MCLFLHKRNAAISLMRSALTVHLPKIAIEKYSALVKASTAIEPGVIMNVLM